MAIFKVFRPEEWAAFDATGQTPGAPIDIQDGFVHFSTASQLRGTLALHFADAPELKLLACDDAVMAPHLLWEPSRGGQLFPHLYRELLATDVLATHDIGWDGSLHLLPEGWS